MELQLIDAVKKPDPIHMAIAGYAGAGKTYSALLLAQELAQGGLIIVIDTEDGRSSQYAGHIRFKQIILGGNFAPERFLAALKLAYEAKPAALIIDGITPEWDGPGGCLEIVNKRFQTWEDVTPRHDLFIEKLTHFPAHTIATIRAKAEFQPVKNAETGRLEIQSLGVRPVQRETVPYLFDCWGMLDQQQHFTVHKSSLLGHIAPGEIIPQLGPEFAQRILAWQQSKGPLYDGAESAATAPAPALTPYREMRAS